MAESPPVPYPMHLEPRYLEKVWGGRRLERALGRALPGDGPIGESWELFDRPAGSSRVRNGPLGGRTLADLRGAREFPLLVKFLDVEANLSIQVHPGEEAARAFGGDPKTEAWVILEAAPGARIWRGLRQGVSEGAFRDALREGRALECLHCFEPKAGDAVLVPAGTVHAMGGGILALEVQQSSETTFRLWDWDRNGGGRRLQIEEGLRAATFAPAGPDRVVPREEEEDGTYRRLLLLATKWFAVEHLTAGGTATFHTARDGADRWHAMVALSGSGVVRAFDRRAPETPFGPGDTLLLPAGQEHYEIDPTPGQVVQALAIRDA